MIVRELVRRLSGQFKIFLVSDDTARDAISVLGKGVIHGHFSWPHGPKAPPAARYALLAWLQEKKVAVVHFHCGGVYGWGYRSLFFSLPVLCRRRGIRVIWTDHLVVPITYGYCGPRKPLVFRLAMLPFVWASKFLILRSVVKEIAVSDHDRDILCARFAPCAGKIRRIYHSRLDEGLPELLPLGRQNHILNVGHVAYRKGQLILARAFCRIAHQGPGWSLHFVGFDSGDGCREEINSLVARSNLEDRVVFHGERADVAAMLGCAGIYVQPSLEEALGLALQEALFYGCPAVGTRVGGIPELIRPGINGLLVEPNNPLDLAEKLLLLARSEEMRKNFSAAGRASVLQKGMTASSMAAAHLDLYNRSIL